MLISLNKQDPALTPSLPPSLPPSQYGVVVPKRGTVAHLKSEVMKLTHIQDSNVCGVCVCVCVSVSVRVCVCVSV